LTTFTAANQLAILAAKVHFHAFAFSIPATFPTRRESILAAYDAAVRFIQGQIFKVCFYDSPSTTYFEIFYTQAIHDRFSISSF
jgi:hypothetical protein